jgi:hypothetical protein
MIWCLFEFTGWPTRRLVDGKPGPIGYRKCALPVLLQSVTYRLDC